ncbi:MAG: toprim domain-containing protein [Bacillus sp. (in: firmicutes)]
MAQMEYKKLVKFLLQDDEQKGFIKELAKQRKMDSIKTYIKRGIFCSLDLDELGYIVEQLGMVPDDLDVPQNEINSFDNGFIIPVWDGYNRLLFYINYSWERDRSKKYINIYPATNREHITKMKMYGMHNMQQALEEDRIVVVEGVFCVLRLESHGIPACSLLGTKILPYHKQFLSRFKRVIYVQDEDNAGSAAWRNFKREIPHAEAFRITGTQKDVDEFAGSGAYEFTEWIEALKRLGVSQRNMLK